MSQQAHCFTPESKHRTHYFYSIAFPRAMGPMAEPMARQSVQGLRAPFEHEDKPMLSPKQTVEQVKPTPHFISYQ